MQNVSYASSTWWTSAFKATTTLPSIGMTSPVSIPELRHPLASMTLSASSRCESTSVNSSSRVFGSKSLRTIGNQFPKQVLLRRTCCNVSMSTMTSTLHKVGSSHLWLSAIRRRHISNLSRIGLILFIAQIELLLDRWTRHGLTLILASSLCPLVDLALSPSSVGMWSIQPNRHKVTTDHSGLPTLWPSEVREFHEMGFVSQVSSDLELEMRF